MRHTVPDRSHNIAGVRCRFDEEKRKRRDPLLGLLIATRYERLNEILLFIDVIKLKPEVVLSHFVYFSLAGSA